MYAADYEVLRKKFNPGIESISHLTYLRGMDPEDIQQELSIILLKCTRTFDPDKGYTFGTYFWNSAKNRVRDLIRTSNRAKRKPPVIVSLSIDNVMHYIDGIVCEPSAERVAMCHMELEGRSIN